MPISLVDYKTPEEQTIFDFYAQHPGATWGEAADALGMDEDHVFLVSNRLRLYGELRCDFSLDRNQLMKFWIRDLEPAPLFVESEPQPTVVESVTPIGRYHMGDR
jgi:hypothetical protein